MYPSSMHAHILRNMVKTLAWFHDTTSNDFIDRTFLQSNAAEHTCVAIFFLRCPTEHVTRKLKYRSKFTNFQ